MGDRPGGLNRLESAATGTLTVAIISLVVLAGAALVVIPSRASYAAGRPDPSGAAESVLWMSPSSAEQTGEAAAGAGLASPGPSAPASASASGSGSGWASGSARGSGSGVRAVRPVGGPLVATTEQVAPGAGGATGYGCQAALQYLSSHAAPDFQIECPGYAFGHQAMTCRNRPGVCPDQSVIVIADPCPAAYMNEAWNSLLADHLVTGRVDPYGSCP